LPRQARLAAERIVPLWKRFSFGMSLLGSG
jgi:hypothetical protein